MGNPCRYSFNGGFIKKPTLDYDKKQLQLYSNFCTECIEKVEFEKHYDKAIIDVYSAPDVIYHYSNGNTNKDEWHRIERWEFRNLNQINFNKHLYRSYCIFEFEEIITAWDESIMHTDIPLGKFFGMSLEDIENYRRKNFVKFKDWKPKPSIKAIEAAHNIFLNLQDKTFVNKEEIEKILIAAYENDM